MSASCEDIFPPISSTAKLSSVREQVERATLDESLDFLGPLVMKVHRAYYYKRMVRYVAFFTFPFLAPCGQHLVNASKVR